jgi:tRNA pseudouridine38-40 synthase
MKPTTDSARAGGERNIRLTVAYDGTDFSGWQTQRGGEPCRTVQGCLEAALETLHKRPVRLTGAGRTDAGVHAVGQTANFYTDIRSMDAGRFVPALNSLLPPDARIVSARETHDGFHARFDAKARTYRYRVIAGRAALPHESRYALSLRRLPDTRRLNALSRLLRGETDCSAFASPKDPSASRCRYIFNAGFYPEGGVLVFEITANAFLWKMVRSIVGTLLLFEEQGASPDDFRALIDGKDRSKAGPAAPPRGLFLWKVSYTPRGGASPG